MSWSRECRTLAGLLSTMGWDSGPTESGEACINFSPWPEKDRHLAQELERDRTQQLVGCVCTKLHRVGFLGFCQGFHLPHEYA